MTKTVLDFEHSDFDIVSDLGFCASNLKILLLN